jgi:uncharacterized protein (TIGR02001 family)
MKRTLNDLFLGKFSLIAATATVAGGILVDASPAMAKDPLLEDFTFPGEFSANVAFTTDYRFRGITQSSNNPALQGGLDYNVDIAEGFGLYLGTWGSTVNFEDGDEASVEIDFYGGVTTEIVGIGIDLGVIYYAYPGADSSLDYDYVEFALGLSYSPLDFVTVGVGYNYSPDYFASSGNFHYPHATIEVTPDLGLPLPLTFSGTYGYSFIDDEATFGAGDYGDWSIGLSTEWRFFTASLQYVDNDLSGSLGDNAVVFTVGASF